MNSFIYRGSEADKTPFDHKIYIGLYKKHFCSILSMSGFFSTAYYCEKCEFAYSSLSRHYCDYTCKNCLTRPACVSDNITQKTCTKCNKTFDNLQLVLFLRITM